MYKKDGKYALINLFRIYLEVYSIKNLLGKVYAHSFI